MTTTIHRPGVTRRAAPALWTGLAVSAVVTAATLLDQFVFGSLETRLKQVYEPYDVAWDGARTLMVVTLLTLGVAGMASWLLTARIAGRRPTAAAALGTSLFVAGLAVAVTLLAAQEYGRTLIPAWLALLNLLPSVVGLVATAGLWRSARPRR